MTETDVLPELKQIIGAMLFTSKAPVTVGDIRRCLEQVAEQRGGALRDFAAVSPEDIRTAIEALTETLQVQKAGFHVAEVASGFRLENDAACGIWLRQLLQKGRAQRLSKPALETLAIIAYRQPATRAEIESVRGVAVDQILRNLMDLQLIRITGRSELPGRPWMFGTTQKFLEYFGLRDVKELPGVEELRRMEQEQEKLKEAAAPQPEQQVLVPAEDEQKPAAPEQEEAAPDASDAPEAAETDEAEAEEDEEEYDDEDDDDEEDAEEDGEDKDEEEDGKS